MNYNSQDKSSISSYKSEEIKRMNNSSQDKSREELLKSCNYRTNNKCIFKSYNVDQDLCKNSNNSPYNIREIATYSDDEFVNFLNKLQNRNNKSSNPSDLSEKNAVKEYIDRCSKIPEYSYLKNISKCDHHNKDQCIFKTYNKDEKGYCGNSNNEKYSVDGLNTFNNDNFKKWLNKLKIKNKPATISSDLSEGEAVNEYMNRCSNIPGFKFLKN